MRQETQATEPQDTSAPENAHGGLNEAKMHAKVAVRSTLLALRGALDFALEKMTDSPETKANAGHSAPPAGDDSPDVPSPSPTL